MKLLPCPFCAGKPVIQGAMGEIWIMCGDCRANAPMSINLDAAAGNWNMRKKPKKEGEP